MNISILEKLMDDFKCLDGISNLLDSWIESNHLYGCELNVLSFLATSIDQIYSDNHEVIQELIMFYSEHKS